MTKRKDYLILQREGKYEPRKYVLDEFQNPKPFKSKKEALQYMKVSSEKALNKKNMFIEPYAIWSDF